MRTALQALAGVLLAGAAAHAQTSPLQPSSPASQQPAPGVQTPAAGVPPPAGTVPIPPIPSGARTFTAPTGIIFNAVRPERVVDFELVIGYLQAALEKATDPEVRAQARGWRMFKATEPGPNGTVLYVFLMDPAVKGAEYGLGRILSDAYPDQIQQIWKLYTGALAGGGSLLNLTPVEPPPLLPLPQQAPSTPPSAVHRPPPQ